MSLEHLAHNNTQKNKRIENDAADAAIACGWVKQF